MVYSEIKINGRQVKLIPLGECACGCGGKTNIPKWNNAACKWRAGIPLKYISGHNISPAQEGFKKEEHPKWNGGIRWKGIYRLVLKPNHLLADCDGYVYEHRLQAEKALGKPLPQNAVVHHHSPNQIVLCENQSYHILLHKRRRAFKECGHANWRLCRFCHLHDDPDFMRIENSGRAYHYECKNAYQKKRRIEKNETTGRPSSQAPIARTAGVMDKQPPLRRDCI